jgi:hypothetical protein
MTSVGWYSQQISLNSLCLVKFYICKPKSTGRGSLIKKQTITIFYFLPAPFLCPCFYQPYYLKLSHVVPKLFFFFNPLCSSILVLPSILPSSLYRVATKIGFTFPHLPKRWNYKQKLNQGHLNQKATLIRPFQFSIFPYKLCFCDISSGRTFLRSIYRFRTQLIETFSTFSLRLSA